MGVIGSLHGPVLDETAWPGPSLFGDLERLGFAHTGYRVAERVFSAGDALADSPRTAIHALLSGMCAAQMVDQELKVHP